MTLEEATDQLHRSALRHGYALSHDECRVLATELSLWTHQLGMMQAEPGDIARYYRERYQE